MRNKTDAIYDNPHKKNSNIFINSIINIFIVDYTLIKDICKYIVQKRNLSLCFILFYATCVKKSIDDSLIIFI